MKKNNLNKIHCYWITGLSGSGKTTISTMLKEKLESAGSPVIQLDGDILRKVFASKAYSYEERKALGFQYARLCQLIINQGFNVVIGVIGLYQDLHTWNRKNIANYIEIFLDTPLEELKRRDSKGIYKKFENGEINNIAGIDIVAEFPKHSDIRVEWNMNKDIETTFAEILSQIKI
ncbi:adenylyl-sulfate kinase [Pelagibacterales bacterium]|nr:adenylyl-sulfate kinase [Pelagibacterales bacterium]